MKQLIRLFSLALILSTHTSFGQSITLSPDNVTTLLCKKWQMDYVIMGGMKIDKMPGATESNFEFKKDNTLIATSNNNSTSAKGTWTYDQSKKLITITIYGNSNVNIISLKTDQLEMLADTKAATPDDPTPVHIFYKPRR